MTTLNDYYQVPLKKNSSGEIVWWTGARREWIKETYEGPLGYNNNINVIQLWCNYIPMLTNGNERMFMTSINKLFFTIEEIKEVFSENGYEAQLFEEDDEDEDDKDEDEDDEIVNHA